MMFRSPGLISIIDYGRRRTLNCGCQTQLDPSLSEEDLRTGQYYNAYHYIYNV